MMKVICPRIDACILLVIALLFGRTPAPAQNGSAAETPAAAHMRGLNNSLLHLHGQMQYADATSAGAIRGQAANVISQRSAALASLIQNEPRAALSFALSPELLADMAAKFPQSSSQLEFHTTVTGPAQQWTADYAKGSRSWWSMNANGHRLYLYFADKEPAGSGELTLQVTGVVVGSRMAVESSIQAQSSQASMSSHSSKLPASNSLLQRLWPLSLALTACFFFLPGSFGQIRLPGAVTLLKKTATLALIIAVFMFTSADSYAQNSCTTTGPQSIIVILATFPGVTPPSNLTQQSVSDMFFGAGPSVTNFWQETSFGATSATGDVFGWFTLNGTYSNTACQSLPTMQSDAMAAAAAAGANFQNYSRVVVIFPDVLGCGWSGLSTIGCSTLSTPSGNLTMSSSYISAATATVQVATHELGHGLGLHHSSTRAFSDSNGNPIALGPLGTAGSLVEYGDSFATMGHCAISDCDGGEYAAPHKAEILNWLSPNVGYQTVQTSGTYVLQPYEVPGGLKALKVMRGSGNNAWLWLEYRQPDGNYDPLSFPSPLWTTAAPQPFAGALVHYEDSTTGIHSHLINFTPGDNSFFSPALVAGQSWSDPYSNLSLSVTNATSSSLTVNVNYSGGNSCVASSPTVVASPLDPSIYPGGNASYNVSITNNDSSTCSASTYNLSSTQPSSWSTSFTSNSISLNPGQSTSVTMTKTGPVSIAPGTYAVDASAGNNSHAGSGTANVTVMSAPTLTASVSVSGTSFTARSTVPITVTVLNGGVPASGATVTFTLTSPSGATSPQSGTTSSAGTATWSYKTSSRSATGTYTVSAQASLTSGSKRSATTLSATSNTLTFTLQ